MPEYCIKNIISNEDELKQELLKVSNEPGFETFEKDMTAYFGGIGNLAHTLQLLKWNQINSGYYIIITKGTTRSQYRIDLCGSPYYSYDINTTLERHGYKMFYLDNATDPDILTSPFSNNEFTYEKEKCFKLSEYPSRRDPYTYPLLGASGFHYIGEDGLNPDSLATCELLRGINLIGLQIGTYLHRYFGIRVFKVTIPLGSVICESKYKSCSDNIILEPTTPKEINRIYAIWREVCKDSSNHVYRGISDLLKYATVDDNSIYWDNEARYGD